ncbi:MAG: arsenate reductase ArsC [Caldimicrobium sp.]
MQTKSLKIGFICTGNSARSQIAEGLAKYFSILYNKEVEVYSAGSNPTGYIHPMAIEVMKEIGIDISDQYSKGLEEIPLKELDLIITLCDHAAETCPYVQGAKIEHWGLPDPAKVSSLHPEAKLNAFRKVRDQIKEKVETLIKSL